MGIVSVSLPTDGTTADVADYNTPITTIVNAINGGLDNANIAAGAAIDGSKLADTTVTNAKLSTAAGEPGAAWQSWTPTWTNLPVTNSTVNAKWIKVGKTVHYRLSVVLAGGDKPSGSVTFTLPTASIAYPGVATTQPIGVASYNDSSTTVYDGRALWASTTTAVLTGVPANGAWATYSNINATAPFTWGNGDEIFVQGTFEAA
jgi:hypothetical protein